MKREIVRPLKWKVDQRMLRIWGHRAEIENEDTSVAFLRFLSCYGSNARNGGEQGVHSEELERSIHSAKAAGSRAMFWVNILVVQLSPPYDSLGHLQNQNGRSSCVCICI
jgi:hypothetical protein